jgi:hypothetical protein
MVGAALSTSNKQMPDTNWQGIKEKNKQVNTKVLTKDLQGL